MQYTGTARMLGQCFSHFLHGAVTRSERHAILTEYESILTRAKEIGPRNTLFASYAMAAYFIAMNRVRTASPEENYQLFSAGYGKSRLLKLSLGNAEQYLSEKKMPARLAWSKETHQRRYENDWVVDVLPACQDYDLGYDYHQCGVCKLCADEGCPELAQYLCRLDFLMADMMGLELKRTQTLAEGGQKCDFRFLRIRP